MSRCLRCLIVDDEEPARRVLRELLAADAGLEIVGEAAQVAAARGLVERLKPDVIFLDVQLRGETGFDLVEKLDPPLPHLVFVTGYDKHAVRAFECNALDYLLKPVLPDRLAETLGRIRGALPRAPAIPAGADDMVFLKASATARFVPWREIHHITAERNYTMVHLESGARLLVHRPLGAWLELAPRGQWLQVHRSVLVRRDTVREICPVDRDRKELVLTGGARVPLGEKYRAVVAGALGME